MGIISSSYFAYGGQNESGTVKPSGLKQSEGQQGRRRPSLPKNCLPLLGAGHYGVGCADIMVPATDEGPGEGCSVFARIFYPTKEHDPEDVSTAAFLSWKPEDDYVEGLANYREMSRRKMDFFLDWVLGDKKVPVKWHVPLAESDQKFPVAVFSHGISGNRFFYTTFCASLASHGFVVAAVEHRDFSCYTFELVRDEGGEVVKRPVTMKKLPHGEEEYEYRIIQVRKRVDETVRMLKLFGSLEEGLDGTGVQLLLGNEFDWAQFKGRLALDNAISIGHSFGGASALAACAEEKGFKNCIILDGWLYPFERKYYTEIDQPVLILNASNWQWPINVKRLLHLKSQAGGIGKAMFTMSDIVHQTFSDFGFLCPGRIGRYFGLQGDLDPLFTGNAIMELCIAFLQDPVGSASKLQEIVATKQYSFIIEGTDVPEEQLDKIDANLAETPSAERGEEEESRVAQGEGGKPEADRAE